MIGFYNYSVIVTYIGVALSVSGMALASTGQFKFAILCLALAGACDTFDGKIARAMKNRTKEMEIFGTSRPHFPQRSRETNDSPQCLQYLLEIHCFV